MKPYHLPSLTLALMIATPALAWPGGGWGGPGGPGPYGPDWNRGGSSHDPREGKVSVDHFLNPDATPALKQPAHVAVVAAPDGITDERATATFEAAVVDQLARAGYDTVTPDPQGGLITKVHTGRDIVEPAEEKHSPVSGEMSAGVSNYGSGFGLGLSVDLTKPRQALIDTRLEASISDRASGKLLWAGRADIVTREGDPHWTDTAIAGKLAGALFAHFAGPKS